MTGLNTDVFHLLLDFYDEMKKLESDMESTRKQAVLLLMFVNNFEKIIDSRFEKAKEQIIKQYIK